MGLFVISINFYAFLNKIISIDGGRKLYHFVLVDLVELIFAMK